VYDNLDYSFTVGHEDGTAEVDAPGGGGCALHEQLAILAQFFKGLDFVRMRPDNSAIQSELPEGVTARALVENGRAYAVYVNGSSPDGGIELALAPPEGAYRAEWVNTKTGDVDKVEHVEHDRGTRVFVSPQYTDDIALRVHKS
jgi:hypothetical protein